MDCWALDDLKEVCLDLSDIDVTRMFLELKRGENAITVARHWCGLLKRVLNEAKLSEQADKRIMEQLQLQIKFI